MLQLETEVQIFFYIAPGLARFQLQLFCKLEFKWLLYHLLSLCCDQKSNKHSLCKYGG